MRWVSPLTARSKWTVYSAHSRAGTWRRATKNIASSRESNGLSEDGNDGSSNHSGHSEHRSEEGHGISRSRKFSPRRGGVTSSASRRDKDAEPEDVATRRGPRWEELEELNPTNYLFNKLLSYRTYRLRNPQTYLSSSRRTAVRKIRTDIPLKVKRDNTFWEKTGSLCWMFWLG